MTSPAHSGKSSPLGAMALLALFPILSLPSSNPGQVEAVGAIRSATVTVAGSLLLLTVVRLLVHDWPTATLLLVDLLLLFFGYGHVDDLERQVQIGYGLVGSPPYLAPLWAMGSLA